ncbi:MAG: helix-turn-helix domain-containing protein [Bdellovibrionaceae bacterium]|nr:helix-turn-helix domain-containing protein [Pseudobdellovibrionaceae bacterium]
MKLGKDVSAQFKELYIVHQNLPGKRAQVKGFDQHILFIPLQGEITVETSDEKHVLGPGQMLYLSPGMAHSFSSSNQGGERLIAMLAARDMRSKQVGASRIALNQLIKEILFYLLLHPKTRNAKSLISVFSETLSEVLEQTPFSGEVEHSEGKVNDPRVRQVLKLLRESVAERVPLEEIAKKSGLSSRNLNRLVLKETGIQPRQWLINFRIDRARELLKKPGASVTDVAYEVGYSSLSQFITAFRSRTGQLPSEYLKRG